MMRSVMRFGWLCLLLVFVVLSAGCGSGLATVSGTVSYEGKPVEEGAINFTPHDGKTAAAGGMIKDGKYYVTEVPPGKKLVEIIGTKKVDFASSSEEAMRRAQEMAAKGNNTGLVDPADTIPTDAEGNRQEVELVPGSQTKDFSLTKKK